MVELLWLNDLFEYFYISLYDNVSKKGYLYKQRYVKDYYRLYRPTKWKAVPQSLMNVPRNVFDIQVIVDQVRENNGTPIFQKLSNLGLGNLYR